MATICVLYGIVDGEDEVFKVEMDAGHNIMDLKKLIYKDSINAAYQVHPQHSTLWKVSALTMSASMLQLTALHSSMNHCLSNLPALWSHA